MAKRNDPGAGLKSVVKKLALVAAGGIILNAAIDKVVQFLDGFNNGVIEENPETGVKFDRRGNIHLNEEDFIVE